MIAIGKTPRRVVRKKRGRGGIEMTPAQKEIFLVIDEWWKKFGFGPTIDDVMRITGDRGRGNVNRKMKALVDLGVCKGLPNRARSIRPAYLKVREIE
jgi:SOS-response transcriptional repressor LexA